MVSMFGVLPGSVPPALPLGSLKNQRFLCSNPPQKTLFPIRFWFSLWGRGASAQGFYTWDSAETSPFSSPTVSRFAAWTLWVQLWL
jgi:hypothetical protein